MTNRTPDPLGLDVESMRSLGYQVVDRVVEHLSGLGESPSMLTGDPDILSGALGGALPRLPGDATESIDLLARTALTHMQHGGHPRYFARVPGPASFTAVLGDWMATGFNAIAASWAGGSGPTTLELVALDWLASLLGLPPGTTGVMCSGGSLANLTALVAIRERVGPGTCYLTDQTHSSIRRALLAIGYQPADIVEVPTDEGFRMDVAALEGALTATRLANRSPTIVIASAGTTNTGAVDPLSDLASLCTREDLWLHVDGAYGAPAAATSRGRRLLDGLDRADTLVVDPHKWLFQPYDLGCVLSSHPRLLESAFTMSPEYLADVTSHREVDLRDRTLELSRRSRAAKLWLTFRTHGADAIAAAIDAGITNAELAEQIVAADPDWEVVTPAQLGIVTFVRRQTEPGEPSQLAAEATRSGVATLTTTTLRGRSVLRLCTINPRTTADDLAVTLTALGVRI